MLVAEYCTCALEVIMIHQCWICIFIRECMVESIINNNSMVSKNLPMGIKGRIQGYQNCHPSQMLIFGGYLKVRGTLYTQVSIWDNLFVGVKVFAWYIDPYHACMDICESLI